MKAPKWNQADKAGSLAKWTEELLAEARLQFLAAGTHIELFFVFGDEGLMEVVPIVGMEKDAVVAELSNLLRTRNGYAFIHIAEATARLTDGDAVSDLLLVHAESRDGFSSAYFSAVATQGDRKLLLDPVQVDGARINGRFTGIFGRL